MTPTRQLGRGLSTLSRPEALQRLEAIARQPERTASLRLLHTATCSPRGWMREAATTHLAQRQMAPGLAHLPTEVVEDPEDQRLLRASVARLLRNGFKHKQRWPAALLRTHLLSQPTLVPMVRGLVWGVYSGKRLDSLFLIDESGDATDLDEEPIDLPAGIIGLPWTIELADDLERCCEILNDHDLISPFSQLYLLGVEGEKLRELVKAGDPSPAVTLARRMDPRHVWAALEALVDDPSTRRDALDVFKGARIQAAIPLFEEAMHDVHPGIRSLAMEAARLMGIDSLLPALAERALAGDTNARMSMSNWQKRRGTKILLPRLEHADPTVRAAAAMAASTDGADKPIGKALARLIAQDPDPRVRLEALVAAGQRFTKIPMANAEAVAAEWPRDGRVPKALERLQSSHDRG